MDVTSTPNLLNLIFCVNGRLLSKFTILMEPSSNLPEISIVALLIKTL